jgi:hypothetical protein
VETLPPPGATADPAGPLEPVDAPPPAERRPGDLTRGWVVVVTLCWVGVVVAFAAVWNTSRQLGLATWWLGPPADAQPFVVTMLPFLAPTLMAAATLNRTRYVPLLGLGAAAVTAAVGVADLGRVRGLGVVEILVAVAAAAVSVAALSGMYRADRR